MEEREPLRRIPHTAHPNIKHLTKILDGYDIDYFYQPQLQPLDLDGRNTTRNPTLYLPAYQTVVIRFSAIDYSDNDSRSDKLKLIYQKNHFNYIPLHPRQQSTPDSKFPVLAHHEYEKYIFDSIEESLEKRLHEFRRKIGKV